MLAAERGNTRVLVELVRRGAKIGVKDNGGNTAMHLAAKNVYLLLFIYSLFIFYLF
jgi:hypothetical protein